MGFEEYVPKENQKKALEDIARTAYNNVLLPACEKLVADSETKWDDLALETFKGFIEDAIDNISKD